MRLYCVSASYDLYPQHCLLPDFTQEEHAIKVNNKHTTLIKRLPTAAKQKLLRMIASALKLMVAILPSSPQRVKTVLTSKGDRPIERVHNAPPITTTNNPTKLRILKVAPQTHGRTTRSNAPGALSVLSDPIK